MIKHQQDFISTVVFPISREMRKIALGTKLLAILNGIGIRDCEDSWIP
jgi:hypothetical protein